MLVVVNLDPFNMQHGFIRAADRRWNSPSQTIDAVDLLSGERYYWRGERNYVRLDPQHRVAHILELRW